MRKFTINEDLLIAILEYLHKKPFNEVQKFVGALSSLPLLEVKKKEEMKKEEKKPKPQVTEQR